MAVDKANIIVSAAVVYVDNVDIGGISGGVVVTKEREVFDKQVDQYLGTLDKCYTNMAQGVEFNIAETDLPRLKLAMDEEAPAEAGGTIQPLGTRQTPEEHELKIVGIGPSATTRTVTFWRAFLIESGGVPFKRDDGMYVSVKFDCILDPTKAKDHMFGQVEDV